MLSSQDKQGSAIDLGLGPPLEPDQLENYKRIQQVWHRWGVSVILLGGIKMHNFDSWGWLCCWIQDIEIVTVEWKKFVSFIIVIYESYIIV